MSGDYIDASIQLYTYSFFETQYIFKSIFHLSQYKCKSEIVEI